MRIEIKNETYKNMRVEVVYYCGYYYVEAYENEKLINHLVTRKKEEAQQCYADTVYGMYGR